MSSLRPTIGDIGRDVIAAASPAPIDPVMVKLPVFPTLSFAWNVGVSLLVVGVPLIDKPYSRSES